jgi:hypothetical protein
MGSICNSDKQLHVTRKPTGSSLAVRSVSFGFENTTFLTVRRRSQQSVGISHQGTPEGISLDSK